MVLGHVGGTVGCSCGLVGLERVRGLPLSDGEYWCEESATLPGPGNLKFYNPAGAFAVQLEDGIPVTARPFDVKYAPNSPTGSEVIYGKKVAAPTEIVQKGHSTFMASIDGHTVECRYESPGR